MLIRSYYDGAQKDHSNETSLKCEDPSRTKQADKDSCDINIIMRKYQKTGLVSHVNRYQGNYADVSTAPQYQDAMNIVINAQEAFSSLTAKIRKRFNNDAYEFLAFVTNPANQEAIYDMGLATRPVVVEEPAPAGSAPPPA